MPWYCWYAARIGSHVAAYCELLLLCCLRCQRARSCVQDYPSLAGLRDELGVPGGKYDFEAQEMQKKQAAYQKAAQAKNEKECSVNKQVL